MAIVLWVFFWTLLLILLAVILLLITPVLLRLHFASAPRPGLVFEVRPLGGLLPWFTVVDSARKARPSPEKHPEQRRKKPKQRQRGKGPAPGRLLRAGMQLVPDVLRRFHFDRLECDIEFGCDDPADTGQLAGMALAAVHGLPRTPRLSLSAQPNFERRCFEGHLTAALHVTLAAFFLPALRFAWRVWGPMR